MIKRVLFAGCMIWFAACSTTEYDLIIENGRILDGSGDPSYTGDLAINADTIAAIGDLSKASARNVIDAEGLAVAPGFINMLSWANVSLLHDGRSMSDIFQGVTLEVMGEGTSMGPLTSKMKLEMADSQGDIKYNISWSTLGEYLENLEENGVSTNIASFVGNGTLRRYVVGFENRPATSEELDQMKELVHEAMREGAVGISSSLLYAPSAYADTNELIELAKVASEYEGMYISHIRDEGDSLLESIDELITIAREANIRSEVYHLKASGESNWAKLDTAITKIQQARDEGLAITADMYNYPASSTGLHVQLPDWVRDGGIEAMIERLANTSYRDSILSDIEFSHTPDKILLVGFENPDLRIHQGKYLSDLSEELEKSPEEAMIDLIVEDDSRIQVVYFSMSEENMVKKVQQPWMSFCSDAGSYAPEGVFLNYSTHPRAYGSFARLLAKYVREDQVISLEEAVRKLTSLPAENLRLEKRGSLKVGHFADVVVFDPETIQDNATFEDPHQLATGVEHVWVNGVQVLKDGGHTGAMPGRVVRGPGYQPL
ncbi:N-acyl-D-amino-acid deacylase family protein [Rhodohalobacter sp. 8-1]|uniref:N-acyl-D-amino-acid deacylase family protein n=1 Tax=Rhodohalobacter sp. 8-1 TaxID=3131972 RepID=UPI0030EE7CAD